MDREGICGGQKGEKHAMGKKNCGMALSAGRYGSWQVVTDASRDLVPRMKTTRRRPRKPLNLVCKQFGFSD